MSDHQEKINKKMLGVVWSFIDSISVGPIPQKIMDDIDTLEGLINQPDMDTSHEVFSVSCSPLVFNDNEEINTGDTVTISGAIEPENNGEFTINEAPTIAVGQVWVSPNNMTFAFIYGTGGYLEAVIYDGEKMDFLFEIKSLENPWGYAGKYTCKLTEEGKAGWVKDYKERCFGKQESKKTNYNDGWENSPQRQTKIRERALKLFESMDKEGKDEFFKKCHEIQAVLKKKFNFVGFEIDFYDEYLELFCYHRDVDFIMSDFIDFEFDGYFLYHLMDDRAGVEIKVPVIPKKDDKND